MRKFFLLFVVFLLFSSLVSAQASNTAQTGVSSVSSFEKVVVKEHFLTKKEIKDHIDSKILDYQKTTEAQLVEAFKEVDRIVVSKINIFIFKLVIAIFGMVVFSGSFWYFIKKKLDFRFDKIKQSVKVSDLPIKTPETTSQPISDKKGSVYTFKDDKPPMDFILSPENQELQKEKERLVKEYQNLKNNIADLKKNGSRK